MNKTSTYCSLDSESVSDKLEQNQSHELMTSDFHNDSPSESLIVTDASFASSFKDIQQSTRQTSLLCADTIAANGLASTGYRCTHKKGSLRTSYFSGDSNKAQLRIAELELKARRQVRSVMKQQLRLINSVVAMRCKVLYVLLVASMMMANFAEAGFWTYYLPNMLKPSGYNEVNDILNSLDKEINATMDNFSDIKYFWGLIEKVDLSDSSLYYPEESVCTDVLPLFREIAIEYTHIDYEYYMKPIESYRNHLVTFMETYYPDGAKSNTILPRIWEQNLYKKQLEFKIQYHETLTNSEEYKKKRSRLNEIWSTVKRSLDISLPCIYLKYAYRQISEDINQFALEMNLKTMRRALEMVESAYKRIEAMGHKSDKAAIQDIDNSLEKREHLRIRS